ncbi:MAG TPA: efflux RND transporter periplasmic adaptor subunit [Thermoanaerobaculia bacterium]|nr:efflux RND transporter periplasmic adaptor subunit [Thermoanaerobaculia bacterium]
MRPVETLPPPARSSEPAAAPAASQPVASSHGLSNSRVARPAAGLALVAPTLIALLSGLAAACSGGGQPAAQAQAAARAESVPVTVGSVVRKTLPVELTAIGRVEPLDTVAVRALVGGELERIHFHEGQDVVRGEPLFTIDPRPFQASLAAAQARLARDQVLAGKAGADVRRYGELVAKEYVTREQFEQTQANAQSLQATINEDKAAIETARLQLNNCSIRAPISGRTGSLMVHAGNLVSPASEQPLVVINQIRPIYVSFAVPESELGAIKQRQAQRGLAVAASAPGTGPEAFRGELTFIDNQVDRATGTILLKATFPNQGSALWPGQFVNVVLTLSQQAGAVVVPAQAVQTGQQGQYVFVVKRDATVESRPVVVSRTVGAEAVVARGLQPGETVVTDGQLRLVPGVRVKAKQV